MTASYEDSQAAAKNAAQVNYMKMFGEGPDDATLNQLIPIYMGTNRNVTDVVSGNAALAKLYEAKQNEVKNDPVAVQQRQRDALLKQAPQYYDQIKQSYQQTLGRAPSQAELDHFAPMFASGNADAYSIGQALQALPEYTQKQDSAAQENLRSNLSSADQAYFTQNLAPAITSQFAQSGRSVNSDSAPLAAAFAQAGTQQNAQREQYLAQIQYGNYANNRQTLMNNYLSNQGVQQQNDYNSRLQQQALANNTYQQGNQVADYGIQEAAYQQYLQQAGRRPQSSGLGGALSGIVSGAGAGAALGPWGALGGGILGGVGGYVKDKNSGGMYSSY